MPRVFVTGDTHGSMELKRLSHRNFPIGRGLTKDDIVIICGDCGFMWDFSNETKWWDDWAGNLNFTIVGVLGNHENYDVIRALPTEEWNGAIVRKIRPSVMYVENGEIFTFNNKKFFVFGGANSTDKMYRKEGVSWWEEEMPSYTEMWHAADNLENVNWKVDYVLTHTCCNSVIDTIDKWSPRHDTLTSFLEKRINSSLEFKYWFSGHMHIDQTVNDKYIMLYNDILEITDDGLNMCN